MITWRSDFAARSTRKPVVVDAAIADRFAIGNFLKLYHLPATGASGALENLNLGFRSKLAVIQADSFFL
jgi:hypothetical protein